MMWSFVFIDSSVTSSHACALIRLTFSFFLLGCSVSFFLSSPVNSSLLGNMNIASAKPFWTIFFISLFQGITSQNCQQQLQTCIAPAMNKNQSTRTAACGTPSLDKCGLYKQTISCIVGNMTSCLQNNEVRSTLNDLQTSARRVCTPDARCPQQLEGCLCLVQKAPANPADICPLLDTFHACVMHLGACQQDASVQHVLSAYRVSAVYCQTGICTEALTCMGDLFENLHIFETTISSLGSASALTPHQLCIISSSVLDCLDRPSCHLNHTIVQQINASFADLCNKIQSADSSAEKCQHFVNCTQAFELFPERFGSTDPEDPSDRALLVTQTMANLTTLEFWCSYLLHSFTCLSDNAQVCGAPGLEAALPPTHLSSVRTLCSGSPPVQEDFIQTSGNLSTTNPVTTNALSSNLTSTTTTLPVPPASNANIGSHGICTTAGRILTWNAAVLAFAFTIFPRNE